MSHIYDNWERLVAAVLKKEELWRLFHEDSRTPSIHSEASSSVRSGFSDVPFGYLVPYPYQQQPKLVFVVDDSPDFQFEDLVGASVELLGKGTFGIAFTANMDVNNGVKIVVKELTSVNMSEEEFKRSMEIVGSVKHENVVPLKASVYSKDGMLMLYDYYNDGSVANLLHGTTGTYYRVLDWETRLRIALGAARGLAYIHSSQRGSKKLVHGNIKPSNIFLNSEKYGCVSDFGLAGMIGKVFMHNAHYHSPEVKSSNDVSQASDIYSFGILLLELLTGKSSVPTGNHEAIDLAVWVNLFKPKEWVSKVLDGDLIWESREIEDGLVNLLQLGIRCVAKAPKKRPKMSSVVKKIEDILVEMSTSKEVPEAVKLRALKGDEFIRSIPLLFLDYHDRIFDFRDLLGVSAEVLGKGTFGTSYHTLLERGYKFRVKRLWDVVGTSKKFQKQMEVLGRIRHENVALAYLYQRDEKLLLYDCFYGDSLYAMLRVKPVGANRWSLDWKARLRIAVGAARGIAHIHKQEKQKLVHGNIKSSNIFLNERKYGCVADAGLAALAHMDVNLMSSFWIHRMGVGYRAPEVIDTKMLSQASDVYSFGVLLLELVSGKPPLYVNIGGENISLVQWIESLTRMNWTNTVYAAELLIDENNQGVMSQVLHIALDCVHEFPTNRPKMYEVVRILEEICTAEEARSESSA